MDDPAGVVRRYLEDGALAGFRAGKDLLATQTIDIADCSSPGIESRCGRCGEARSPRPPARSPPAPSSSRASPPGSPSPTGVSREHETFDCYERLRTAAGRT